MLPRGETASACQGQRGYGAKVIFEPIIGFHQAIKSTSSRKEGRNKVAKTWTQVFREGGLQLRLVARGRAEGRESRKAQEGGSKCHTKKWGRVFRLQRALAGESY